MCDLRTKAWANFQIQVMCLHGDCCYLGLRKGGVQCTQNLDASPGERVEDWKKHLFTKH